MLVRGYHPGLCTLGHHVCLRVWGLHGFESGNQMLTRQAMNQEMHVGT